MSCQYLLSNIQPVVVTRLLLLLLCVFAVNLGLVFVECFMVFAS